MGLFRSRPKAFTEVTAKDAIDLVANGAILIDVRTGLEWSTGHADGARHIPLELVGLRSKQIPADADVVVICQSGHRSALAARTLARRGFTVSSVVGGTPAWKRAGGAIVSPGDLV
ncbi:rhodanese-like domain-containing protein [Frigoribacterium sp. UYMn621]|uniref:rhodanese-like domain-containing protein n=1 Tax=Frigoribacterium sp. UYMn621 TaxID=3156343 RepID=UPI003392D6F4